MRITNEQKDKMPSTNLFVWIVPVFLFCAWITKTEAIEVHKWPIAAVGTRAEMSRCEAANICILGWYL